jgi:ATP-dependent Lhr-like helicase
MSDNPFYQLAPFIQEYIYRQKWEALRPVQVSAIQAILNTSHHILISSGTASGKTEAAMLPILTELEKKPSTSIGVLYIGPLKALINDQFERIQVILEETNIPVQSWHGDVAQSKKERFLREAQGILQITPESLEALLINRHTELKRLLGDLRFVVIDEVHAFIGSDRGRQILCQLQRLERYQTTPPRRVGLSATIGEPELALRWLGSGTKREVTLVSDPNARRDVSLGLEHFVTPSDDDEEIEGEEEGGIEDGQPSTAGEGGDSSSQTPRNDEIGAMNSQGDGIQAGPVAVEKQGDLALALEDESALYEHIYAMCQSANKTLIFANQRAAVEKIVTNLRALAARNHTPDNYHVHHGSISTELREGAENAMRDPSKPATVAATLTLELGIDIGRLDQVLQVNATHSVSSFVQRLGRSGRRGTPSQMFFYCQEEAPDDDSLVERVPWNLLQTIAIIQLYLEERWVEPPEIPKYPTSLLYHQTISILVAATELTPAQLAERVLTLAPLQAFTQDDYRTFLRHLLATQHLEQTETGTLIVGLAAEKLTSHYHFYATFEDQIGYRVLAGAQEIGAIGSAPEEGETFRLAGFTWRAVTVDLDAKAIQVERARGKGKSTWLGGGVTIHTRILQRMRQVLQEDDEYAYLHKRARQRLQQARQLARSSGILENSIVESGGGAYLLLPWQGTKVMQTLALFVEQQGLEKSKDGMPYYMQIREADSEAALRHQLSQIVATSPAPEALISRLTPAELVRAKYDRYAPEALLRQAYVHDALDYEGALEVLRSGIG